MLSRLTLALLLVLVYLGCDGTNETKCRQSVVEGMKTTEIVPVPGHSYYFIVRDTEGAIWYVETMGGNADISAKTVIFKPKTN